MRATTRFAAVPATLLALLAASGCAVLPGAAETDSYAPTLPPSAASGPAPTGSIYADGYDVRLFEDLKARRVGDVLTIRLEERTDARKSSSTSTARTTAVDIANPTIAGRPVTAGGTPILENSLDAAHSFDGEGDSSQSNQLTGNITVTIAERLPNGNLVVRGEKWITINQGEEFVRISGIVRPFDILPDNSVPSSKVADARIVYSGKGALADANRQGWLTRFFNSSIFPF